LSKTGNESLIISDLIAKPNVNTITSMWSTEVTRTTTASKEKIWYLWSDVQNWKTWDKDVESAELFGAFKQGTKGVMKPSEGPRATFSITECTRLKSFTNTSALPLCRIDFIHVMNETEGRLEVKHQVVMTGILTFLFSKIIGRKIEAGLPYAVDSLVKTAETEAS
jgi:hypothetical protein